MDKMELILAAMTPMQRRRYKKYISGATLTYIAEQEGVSVVAVHKSIKRAEKRAKKRLRGLKGG